MTQDLFRDDITHLLTHCLAWRSRAHEIIAGNLANLDTPGFTSKEFPFREVLHQYLQGSGPITLEASHPAHLRPKPAALGLATDRGQPVDLDEEMVHLSENQLNFHASVQLLNRKLEGLRTVVEGGKP